MPADAEKPIPQRASERAEKSEHEDIEVVLVEQEAVDDAYHVHLSWRSWVYISPGTHMSLAKSLTDKQLVVFITCFA